MSRVTLGNIIRQVVLSAVSQQHWVTRLEETLSVLFHILELVEVCHCLVSVWFLVKREQVILSLGQLSHARTFSPGHRFELDLFVLLHHSRTRGVQAVSYCLCGIWVSSPLFLGQDDLGAPVETGDSD